MITIIIFQVLFIFTPPLAGFLADRIGNFRVLLSFLTAAGGDSFLYHHCDNDADDVDHGDHDDHDDHVDDHDHGEEYRMKNLRRPCVFAPASNSNRSGHFHVSGKGSTSTSSSL